MYECKRKDEEYWKMRDEVDKRNEQIYADYLMSPKKNYAALGRKYNLSRESVRVIITRIEIEKFKKDHNIEDECSSKEKRNKEIIDKWLNGGMTYTKLGQEYNLNPTTIKKIIKKKIYNAESNYTILKSKIIYPNLREEIILNKMDIDELSDKMEMQKATLLNKLNGSSEFKLNELMKMKEILNSQLIIEELFKKEE